MWTPKDIVELRIKYQMTEWEFATKKLHVAVPTLQLLERGIKRPTLFEQTNLDALKKALPGYLDGKARLAKLINEDWANKVKSDVKGVYTDAGFVLSDGSGVYVFKKK